MSGKVKIRDKAWRRLAKLMISDRSFAKVGILQAKGGNETTDEGITMVALGTIHEYGAPAANIPERSFIRKTFADTTELKRMQAKLAKAVITLKMSHHRALDLLGAWGAAEVKKFITSGQVKPDVKPATLQRKTVAGKRGTTTLVDTGRLLNSITWEVVKK
jgi:hypothetical protein